MVRLDRGTENVHIASCQKMLRAEHNDSLVSCAVMYGSSTHNQRIERFWLYLRKATLNEYMNLFKDYADSGIIDMTLLTHRECLAFCFMEPLRNELNSITESWNNHRVRRMKHGGCPSGVPNVLFNDPSIYGFEEQAVSADRQILVRCVELHRVEIRDCDLDFEEWALHELLAHSLKLPTNLQEGIKVFNHLIVRVHELLL